jgi:hypothetical protein
MKRKKFFTSLGTALTGILLLKSIPSSLRKEKKIKKSKTVKIILSPDAVSRTKKV